MKCIEDGGHYRPRHHAAAARSIINKLSESAGPDNGFSVRRIYQCLPSFSEGFMRHEPLTRIRDIAHRNDIPKELKKEIKHSLQNKLHRSASPDDLITATGILNRITSADADYPADFIREFKLFHAELSEFFNAHSLEQRLEAVSRDCDTRTQALMARFIKAKQADANDLDILVALTDIRDRIGFLIKQGPLNIESLQSLGMADAGLEDYCFVVLSKIANELESLDPARLDIGKHADALRCAMVNVGLSAIEPGMSKAVENELSSIIESSAVDNRIRLLRLKSAIECVLNICDLHTDKIMGLFTRRAHELGIKLGVDKQAVDLFCEGDIRGSVVFQSSRIASAILQMLRPILGLQPWGVISAGESTGLLIKADWLDELYDRPARDDVIVMLTNAEGDEELPACVRGVVLMHDLPHLSHFSVRARQHHVAFATCREPGAVLNIDKLMGKRVRLYAAEGKVEISPDEESTAISIPAPPIIRHETIPDLRADAALIGINQAAIENSGAKAFAANKLRILGETSNLFKTPKSAVIPFGVMHAAFMNMADSEYYNLVSGLSGLDKYQLKEAADKLRHIMEGLKPPDELVPLSIKIFGPDARLIVRSSSNREDTEIASGAGLYESIADVKAADMASAVRAVWGSIWTERATRSRMKLNQPHGTTLMAVLIQEMILPDYSFVIHTVNAVNLNPDEIYIEAVCGMGEALASGKFRGLPYGFVYNKHTGFADTVSFSSMARAVMPGGDAGLTQRIIDYSREPMTIDDAYREAFIKRVGNIGAMMEKSFGPPQDIEGGIKGGDVYIFQSRPEPGIR